MVNCPFQRVQNVYKITRLGVGKEMQEETAKRVGH